MKPYPNEELERMSKREIIRLYKRTVEQFNDAVPVIRCKDCAYYLTGYEQTRYCAKDGILKRETYYCAGAERKEDDS